MMAEYELNVAEILRATTCALVRKKLRSADHGHRDIADPNLCPVTPSL
jgi:hypothetical protein